jgi:hypothetical protein
MGVLAVMFLMLLSFVKAFYIKDRASSAAEQASLAATAYVYGKVDEAISDIDKELSSLGSLTIEVPGGLPVEAEVTLGQESLEEQIEERANALLTSSSRFTSNEARIQAIDEILSEELQEQGPRQTIVEEELLDALGANAVEGLHEVISRVIQENDGIPTDSQFQYFNHEDRMEVQTSSMYTPIIFEHLFSGEGMKVKQVGRGPRVEFVKHLAGFQSRLYTIQ